MSFVSDLYQNNHSVMAPISLLVLLLVWSPLILCKKQDPVCVEHSSGAYPCESRPSREPLSLQYNKAQSEFIDLYD